MFADSCQEVNILSDLASQKSYNFLNNGSISKIQLGSESWEQGLQILACY